MADKKGLRRTASDAADWLELAQRSHHTIIERRMTSSVDACEDGTCLNMRFHRDALRSAAAADDSVSRTRLRAKVLDMEKMANFAAEASRDQWYAGYEAACNTLLAWIEKEEKA
jgi:hypothetical protein